MAHPPIPSIATGVADAPVTEPPGEAASETPWRLLLVVWLLPCLADVADVYFARHFGRTQTPLWRVIAEIAPGWALWVPLSAGIVRLDARWPIARPHRATAVAVHVAGGCLAAALHAIVVATMAWTLGPHRASTWTSQLGMTLVGWLPFSLLLYLVALGGAHALAGLRRARVQERHAAALAVRLAEVELAALRAQLEPHFLFNALNTAVSLVRAGRSAAGVEVLTRLGELLRHSLHGVAQHASLAEELRLLEAYLDIERARFGERLTVHVDVGDAPAEALVPSLVVQSLVENALRHGVGRRATPGHVWITARAQHDMLVITVRDDGPGPIAASRPGAVGLRNARDRLARMYGAAAGLVLEHAPAGGALATLRLPLRYAVHGARSADGAYA